MGMASGIASTVDRRVARTPRRTGRRRIDDPGRSGAAGTAARSILRGELANIGLSTLLTIMDIERRSGLLVIERSRPRPRPPLVGRVAVRQGRVIRADIDGARVRTGAEAVYEILGWTIGKFDLWQSEVEGEDEVGASTTFLLIEAARRADDAAAARSRQRGAGPAMFAPTGASVAAAAAEPC
jgi:Domain of unknown function (DUF4388)